MNLTIGIKRLHPDAVIPRYQTDGAAGMDLHSLEDAVVEAGRWRLFYTGIALEIPQGFEGQIRPRSGLALAHGSFTVFGTIDSDYRGPIGVNLFNFSSTPIRVRRGDRIAQIVFAPVERVVLVERELNETARSHGGFGSTGER